MEPKITTFLPTCFYITAMHSVCCCSLPVWRRSFLKKGTPVTYFCPALDPPLDGSGRKTTTLVRDLEYFIHTKFHQNPSSGFGEEVENVNSLTDDGRRTTDGRTPDKPLAPVPWKPKSFNKLNINKNNTNNLRSNVGSWNITDKDLWYCTSIAYNLNAIWHQ